MSIEVNDDHPLNILVIYVTCEVTKLDTFIDINDEQ